MSHRLELLHCRIAHRHELRHIGFVKGTFHTLFGIVCASELFDLSLVGRSLRGSSREDPSAACRCVKKSVGRRATYLSRSDFSDTFKIDRSPSLFHEAEPACLLALTKETDSLHMVCRMTSLDRLL